MLEQEEEAHLDAERRHLESVDAEHKRHRELLQLREEETYKRQNPGEYECPHCKYKSLRSEASRCPLCQGAVGSEYWSVVRAREKADGERNLAAAEAAAERRKADDELQKAEAMAAKAARAAAEQATAAEWLRNAPKREAAAQLVDLEKRLRSIKYGASAGKWLGLLLAGVILALVLSLLSQNAVSLLIAPIAGFVAAIGHMRQKAFILRSLNSEKQRLLEITGGNTVSKRPQGRVAELSPNQKLALIKNDISELKAEIAAVKSGNSPEWL